MRVPLSFVWLVLVVLTILEAVNDLFGVAGPAWLYSNWVMMRSSPPVHSRSSVVPPFSRFPTRLAGFGAHSSSVRRKRGLECRTAGNPKRHIRRLQRPGALVHGRGRDVLPDPGPRPSVRTSSFDRRVAVTLVALAAGFAWWYSPQRSARPSASSPRSSPSVTRFSTCY